MSLISKTRNYESFFSIKLKNKKDATKKQYKYAIADFDKFCRSHLTNSFENLIPEFQTAKTEDIIDTLQSWINESALCSTNLRGRITQVNNYLYYRGIKIDPRDMKDLEYKAGIPEERRPTTDEELRKILDVAKPMQKTLYLTLSSSGMAIGECCHLLKSDFDFSQSRIQIHIKPSYTKKNSRGRTVYISKEAEKYLKPILDEIAKKDLVFANGKNIAQSTDNYQTQFRRLVDKIGLDERYESGTRQKTLHALRAYFFSKATQKHGIAYAHRICGHRGYLEEYNRYEDEKKLSMYLELEPELFIYEKKPDSDEVIELREKLTEALKNVDRLKSVELRLDEIEMNRERLYQKKKHLWKK